MATKQFFENSLYILISLDIKKIMKVIFGVIQRMMKEIFGEAKPKIINIYDSCSNK